MSKNPKSKSIQEIVNTWQETWAHRLRERRGGKAVTQADLKAKADVKNLTEQIAAMKIADHAAKGSSGRPGLSASISIGEVFLKENEIEEFEDNIEIAKEILQTKNMVGLDDLDEARKSLDKLSNKKKALSDFMKKNSQFEHYQVVSFSTLTAKHLVSMGVSSKILSQNHLDQVLQVFHTFSPNPMKFRKANSAAIIFEQFWLQLTKDGRYIDDFKILKNRIGKKPEARARMLTDYILMQLMVFVHKHLDLVQFMFLELVLSSSSHPVLCTHKDTATLLTGSVDYAIWSSVDARADLAKSLGANLDEVDDMIRTLTSESSLDDIMHSKIWPTLQRSKHFKFTIIEEKRKDLGKKELQDCEPQVTGEALALKLRTGQAYVLWCLSNGEDWIFGILDDKKQSRSLPTLSIYENDLEGSIKAILKMLILWTVCPVDMLKRSLGM